MTSLNETKITEALAAAKRASSRDEQDKHERAAIAAWRQIAFDTGLDAIFIERAMRDADQIEQGKQSGVTLDDLKRPYMGDTIESRRYAWAALASYLNDLRIGLLRLKAGESIINAARSIAKGQGSWLTESVSKQGIDGKSESKEALNLTIVGEAATYDAVTGCGVRAAVHYAITEHGATAARVGLPLNAETLRRRIESDANSKRGKDELATHYRQMFKLMSKPSNRAAIGKADAKIKAEFATIRGTTSSSKNDSDPD
jgi:hypothetical protein